MVLPRNLPDLGAEHEADAAILDAFYSGLNVLKQGPATPILGVPEDAEAVERTVLRFYEPLTPQNRFDVWLVEQVSLATLKIDQCDRIERRLRDRQALRARLLWNDDRRGEAIALGSRLAADPEAVAHTLGSTRHGCEWLIDRWSRLAHAAGLEGGWTPEQAALAFDLLGTPREFRAGSPCDAAAFDPSDDARTPSTPAEFARDQVARLKPRRDRLADLDQLDRSLAMADYRDEPTEEIRRLRRQLATLHSRLKFYLTRLPKPGQCAASRPGIQPVYSSFAEDVDDEAAYDLAQPAAEADPAIEGAEAATLVLAARRSAVLQADVHRLARLRKQDRRSLA